jgi:hypothetical protein
MSNFQIVNVEPLLRRHVVTMDEAERNQCCGLGRDLDGFCQHRPGHPVFIQVVHDVTVSDNRPSTDDLLGIAPDWTGGLSTDEYMNRQRRR